MAQTKEDRIVRVGDRVVFRDKYKGVHTGTIAAFERDGGAVSAHIKDVEDETCGYVVGMSSVTKVGSALAESWLHPAAHLNPGQVVLVTFTGAARTKVYGGVADGDLAVVLQDKGDLVNVAKLCGTGRDQYARLPHSCLTVADIKGAVMELALMAKQGDL
jgi:hypothetical protein